MGVKFLTGFISANSGDLLVSQVLENTVIIVDGYNLLHELYYSGPAETAYGGDYDLFAKSIEKFCSRLRTAKISPYFVFDGASELDDAKLTTTVQRAKERIHLAGISSHRKRTKILPCLAFQTCLDKLRELSIPYCLCDHEADQQLASLASQWNCPLISNDSDFLLHELPGGVVTVNELGIEQMLDPEEQTGVDDGLSVRIFKISTLCELYDIKDQSLVALLSVICGNDSFPQNDLSSFRRSLDPKATSTNIAKYLKWLSKFASVEAAVRDIIRTNSNPKRLQIKIMETLKSYKILSNHICDYFTSEKILHDFVHPLHEGLPLLFWSRYRKALISKKCLELLLFNRRIFVVQMEKLDNPSSWHCSQEIRQRIYKILSASVDGGMATVKEYDREKKKLIIRHVDVDLHENLSLSLSDLYAQSTEQNLRMFYHTLGITEEDIGSGLVKPDSPTSSRDNDILTAIILHWANHSLPYCFKIHVMAVLVGIINLSLIEHLIPGEDQLCQKVNRHSHTPTQDQKHKDGLALDTLHAMAQFQCVLGDSLDLLGLLAIDVDIHIHRIFSGRYVYNLCVELSKRSHPLLYCEELLVRGSDHSLLFKQWYTLIENHVQSGCLVDMGNTKLESRTVRQAAKKAAKNAAKKKADVCNARREGSDSSEEHHSETDDDNEEVCDQLLGNKFALLSLRKS